MRQLLLPLTALLLLLPASASAAPAESRNDEGAVIREIDADTKAIIFETGEGVEGETLSPNGVNIRGAQARKHANMISIRGQFVPELTKLANDI